MMTNIEETVRSLVYVVNDLVYAVREIYALENSIAENVMNHTPHADNANIRHVRKSAFSAVDKLRLVRNEVDE